MIDTERMTEGEALAEELRKGRAGGLPWMVILDAEGEELVTSVGPDGNCGCPVTEAECAWFMTMIERSSTSLGDEEKARLKALLEAFAAPIRRR